MKWNGGDSKTGKGMLKKQKDKIKEGEIVYIRRIYI